MKEAPKPLPKRLRRSDRPYLPRQQRRSIKLDRVHPADLRSFDARIFCEDCSHFSSEQYACTIGYRAQHTRAEQLELYERTGKIAFCRALEID